MLKGCSFPRRSAHLNNPCVPVVSAADEERRNHGPGVAGECGWRRQPYGRTAPTEPSAPDCFLTGSLSSKLRHERARRAALTRRSDGPLSQANALCSRRLRARHVLLISFAPSMSGSHCQQRRQPRDLGLKSAKALGLGRREITKVLAPGVDGLLAELVLLWPFRNIVCSASRGKTTRLLFGKSCPISSCLRRAISRNLLARRVGQVSHHAIFIMSFAIGQATTNSLSNFRRPAARLLTWLHAPLRRPGAARSIPLTKSDDRKIRSGFF